MKYRRYWFEIRKRKVQSKSDVIKHYGKLDKSQSLWSMEKKLKRNSFITTFMQLELMIRLSNSFLLFLLHFNFYLLGDDNYSTNWKKNRWIIKKKFLFFEERNLIFYFLYIILYIIHWQWLLLCSKLLIFIFKTCFVEKYNNSNI